ncbi:hypothetical protein PMIN02_004807 [Paraphaeosphaeria minitans]
MLDARCSVLSALLMARCSWLDAQCSVPSAPCPVLSALLGAQRSLLTTLARIKPVCLPSRLTLPSISSPSLPSSSSPPSAPIYARLVRHGFPCSARRGSAAAGPWMRSCVRSYCAILGRQQSLNPPPSCRPLPRCHAATLPHSVTLPLCRFRRF